MCVCVYVCVFLDILTWSEQSNGFDRLAHRSSLFVPKSMFDVDLLQENAQSYSVSSRVHYSAASESVFGDTFSIRKRHFVPCVTQTVVTFKPLGRVRLCTRAISKSISGSVVVKRERGVEERINPPIFVILY